MSTETVRVDAFMARAKSWRGEMQKLRSILLGCGLLEELKWGKPCYKFEGKNIAILQPFKNLCALMFFKGDLLKDPRGHLRSQGDNTQSALRLEFTNERQITAAVIKDFVKQAVASGRPALHSLASGCARGWAWVGCAGGARTPPWWTDHGKPSRRPAGNT
jgi:uncharacterized protein YdeI (YjbR/CyaY-like superfamily)